MAREAAPKKVLSGPPGSRGTLQRRWREALTQLLPSRQFPIPLDCDHHRANRFQVPTTLLQAPRLGPIPKAQLVDHVVEQWIEFRGIVPNGDVQIRAQLPKSLFQQVTAIDGVEQPMAPGPCFDTPQHAPCAGLGRGIWCEVSFISAP